MSMPKHGSEYNSAMEELLKEIRRIKAKYKKLGVKFYKRRRVIDR